MLSRNHHHHSNHSSNEERSSEVARGAPDPVRRYGQMIELYEPSKDKFYNAVSEYYQNPNMIKIRDVNQYSVYMVRVHSLLSKDCRYIIAMVQKDINPIGYRERLNNLRWSVFQTRTLEEENPVPQTSYTPRHGTPLDSKVTSISRDTEKTTYQTPDFPINIILLHKRGILYEYPEHGTVVSCLETYQTVVNFRE